MNPLLKRLTVLFFVFLMLITAGCAGTKASRFYTLHPTANQADGQASVSKNNNVVVSIGHIEIPNILDRPQIVTYSGNNQVEFLEFDRWAGSFKDDISRVLIKDLSSLVAKDGISVVSWRQPGSSDYRIDLNINRFGSISDSEVALSVRWIVMESKGKNVIHIKESDLIEPIEGAGVDASVAAMSRAIGELSRELADYIAEIQGVK